MMPIDAVARVFISHSSTNNPEALALRDWLCGEGIDDVFLDVDPERGLVSGDRWQEALKAAADRCEAILFLISPAWVQSKWCLAEFLLAKTLHKRIFGLLVEAIPIDRIPLEMTSEWQLCDLTAADRKRTFDLDMGTTSHRVSFSEPALRLLWRGLERAGLGARSFRWPPETEKDRAPYRGLRALDAEDAAIFFGRDAMIVRGLDRIRGLVEGGVDNCLIILGSSGSGKSSFLRAGLLPRLLRNDSLFLPLPIVRPEAAVISGAAGLARSLAAAFDRLGAPRGTGSIKAAVSAGGEAFGRLLQDLAALNKQRLVHLDAGAIEPTIVLSIDQAEELFNPDGATESAIFRDLLTAMFAAGHATTFPPTIVLATVRSDRYDTLQSEQTIPGMKRQLLDLTPIPPAEFKSVIEGPALRSTEAGRRLTIDPELTEELMKDAGGADALPLLGFALERLYSDFGAEGHLALAHYRMLGGVRGSIEAAVAQALANPGASPAIPAGKDAQLAGARAAFIPWLARVMPETGAPIRRVAQMAEIPEGSRTIVERLTTARLLVTDRRAGVDVIEVAHESLLRQWSALVSWLDADAEDLKVLESIERAADEWAHNGKVDPWLDHRGDRLSIAKGLTARDDFRKRIGPQGLDYLAACTEREDRERVERQEALDREQRRLEEIAAAQARTEKLQRTGRWTLVMASIAVLVGAVLGVWQHLGNLRLKDSLRVEQASLQQAQKNLDEAKTNFDKAQTKLLVQLSTVERLRDNFDAALRFAIYGARHSQASDHSAADQLAAIVSRVQWQLLIDGENGSVGDASFSPDGTTILTAAGKNATIWNIDSGKPLMVFRGHTAPLWSAVFSRDGSKVLTAGEDGTARLWDARTGRELATFRGHADKVTSASFSPDGRLMATASFDKTVRIWDVATGQTITVLRGHTNTVQSALFNADGSRIVTASDDTTARLWTVATGQQIKVFSGHTSAVYYAAFSPDGTRIVTGSNDYTGRVWDVGTGETLVTLRGHRGYINCVDYSPDGSQIITASADQTARLWDAKTGHELTVLRGHEGYVNTAHFSADGKHVVTGSHDQTARLWDIAAVKTYVVFAGHASGVNYATLNADDSRVATASNDKTVRLWDAKSGRQVLVMKGHEAPVMSVAFSPDGARLVSASQDRTARIWDATTGEQLLILRGSTNWVMAAAFSHDGTRIATASWDTNARTYDAATGRPLLTLSGHTSVVAAIAFSPDGTKVATGSWDKTARIWDAATGEGLKVLPHDGTVLGVAFSRDGTHLLTASDDRTALIWDVATGAVVTSFAGHEGSVHSAQFSPDMAKVVTASDDRTARIWDAPTGNQLKIVRGHEDEVHYATFNKDGSHILTASSDTTARLWDVTKPDTPADVLIRQACIRLLGAKSKMTRDDLQFLPSTPKAVDVCAGLE